MFYVKNQKTYRHCDSQDNCQKTVNTFSLTPNIAILTFAPILIHSNIPSFHHSPMDLQIFRYNLVYTVEYLYTSGIDVF